MTNSKKQVIFRKYGGHCAYCGRPLKMKAMSVDHLVPKSKGGGNSIENLMPCCRECNEAKAADSLEMLRIHLVWSTLSLKDILSFKTVRLIANRYKFYFEVHSKM